MHTDPPPSLPPCLPHGSLKMNLDATIVDWHKHIMELEIESAADPSNGTSPFWDIPNLLCGRNYTEKAEVVFKEIVEQRALELLPPVTRHLVSGAGSE